MPKTIDKIFTNIKNKLPSFISFDEATYIRFDEPARFIDSEYGEWWATPKSILNGRGHPTRGRANTIKSHTYTIDKVKSLLPDHIKLIENTYTSAMVPAIFVDSEYGEWNCRLNDILNGHGHPNRAYVKTSIEKKIEDNLGFSKFNKPVSRELSYRPDFKLSDTLYLNVDGLFWHSEKIINNKKHHFDMRKEFESKKIRIIQFREDEVNFKLDIVKSIIHNLTGNSNKVFARKLHVVNVENKEASEFLLYNHLMGSIRGVDHMGLRDESGELISVMSYRLKERDLVIERFCCSAGLSVIGGLSRLLSNVEKSLHGRFDKITYWVDLRYGNGKAVENLGFEKKKVTLGWKWTDRRNTFNRLKCRANMDNRKLSEREHAEELGWIKIYDAGQAKFVKNNA